jgi:hypothetical protein
MSYEIDLSPSLSVLADLGSPTQRYVKRHPLVRKGAEISRSWRFCPPVLPYVFRVRFWGSDPTAFWRALTGTGCSISKTLELGTIGYERAIPGKAWKNMFINNVPKPVFRCNFVKGFKERMCWPAGQSIGSKPLTNAHVALRTFEQENPTLHAI